MIIRLVVNEKGDRVNCWSGVGVKWEGYLVRFNRGSFVNVVKLSLCVFVLGFDILYLGGFFRGLCCGFMGFIGERFLRYCVCVGMCCLFLGVFIF